MDKKIVKGNELMVFDNSKSIAFATSHTLTVTAETLQTACKDYGDFGSTEVGKINWEIQSENLYSDEGYDTLFTKMMAKQPIDLVWGHADYDVNGLGEKANWTTDTTKTNYKGKALITSLTTNAAGGENATFSVTFTGQGSFTKVEAVPGA